MPPTVSGVDSFFQVFFYGCRSAFSLSLSCYNCSNCRGGVPTDWRRSRPGNSVEAGAPAIDIMRSVCCRQKQKRAACRSGQGPKSGWLRARRRLACRAVQVSHRSGPGSARSSAEQSEWQALRAPDACAVDKAHSNRTLAVPPLRLQFPFIFIHTTRLGFGWVSVSVSVSAFFESSRLSRKESAAVFLPILGQLSFSFSDRFGF